jgi:hypothetical protein
MATKSEHVVANAVRADSSGIHKIPVEDSTNAASRTVSEPPSQILENENHGDLPWLLAAVGVVLAAVVGLKYIAPGFLAGLVLGLFLVLLAQAALVWFVWEKVQARREDSIGHSSMEMRKAESPKTGPELERQASVSNEVRNLVHDVCSNVDPACMQTQPLFYSSLSFQLKYRKANSPETGFGEHSRTCLGLNFKIVACLSYLILKLCMQEPWSGLAGSC